MAFDYHPAALAAETTDYQAGTTKRLLDAVTYGGGSAVASGGISIYNSFLGMGRGLGITDSADVNVESVVRQYGGDNMGNYYAENKGAIDTVGFIGTALIPGSIGVWGLRAARAGLPAGNFSKFLNLAPSRKSEYLEAALAETARGGGAVKSIFNANRLNYAKWEVADQAMQAAAAEALIGVTMWNSPVFTGDSMSDFGWNALTGVAIGGGLGGVLGSIAAKGILKSASVEIQAQSRLHDIVKDSQKLGLAGGTDALVMAESLLTAPTKFDDLLFKYKLDGQTRQTQLPTAGVLEHNYMESQRLGYDKLALKFNELAGGDPVRGQAYYEFLTNGIEAARGAGLSPTEITQRITGYLVNLKAVTHLDLDRLELDKRKFYLTLRPQGKGQGDSRFLDIISPERTANTSKQAYRLADDVTAGELLISRYDDLGVGSIKQAFKQNPEVDVLQLSDGTLRVNPASKRVLKHAENPVQVRQLIDLETGSLTNETAAVIGDILQPNRVSTRIDGIEVNGTLYKQQATRRPTLGESALESSARWAWASKLTAPMVKALAKDGVHEYDFPMLARMSELAAKGEVTMDDITVVLKGDAGNKLLSDVAATPEELRAFVNERRVEWAELEYVNWEEGMGSVPDVRVMAAHLNTEYQVVEDIIESGFDKAAISSTKGRIMETAEAFKPRTVQGVWDYGNVATMTPQEAFRMNMGPSHLVTQELTKEYQVRTRALINQGAAQRVLGEDAELFRAADDLLAQDTGIQGAGATLFGASNAGYGERARLWVQNTGRAVAQTVQKWQERTVGALSADINLIRQSEAASAELGLITHMLRSSKHRYVFDDTAEALPGPLAQQRRLVSEEAMELAKAREISIDELLDTLPKDAKHPHTISITDESVSNFLFSTSQINATRQQKFTVLHNAAGVTRKTGRPVVYAPPVDTVRYPFHAIVKTKQIPGLATDHSMIVARSEEELRAKVASLGDDYDVFYKKDTENYFKIKGEYDYGNTISEARVNSDLARRGVLDGFLPETRFENVMTDWLKWHGRQDERLVRNAVETQSRQFFSELQLLSENYRKTSESVSRGIGSLFQSKVADPFGDYIKTALNISKQQEFPLLDSLNEFVDKLGVSAGDAINKAFGQASKGLISWEDANKLMKSKGYGGLYDNAEQYFAFNQPSARNLIRETLQKGNMLLATTMLRFDFANSLVNVISTPILIGTEMASIKRMIAGDDKLAGKLKELTSVKLPDGSGAAVPSTMKLLTGAVNSFFSPEAKSALMPRYERIGAIKTVASQYRDMLELATYQPLISATQWSKNIDKGIETVAKWTGNTLSEDFTRYVSADVMRQMTEPLVEAGKLTVKEQDAYISTFVNRVQGNYVTSQRPVVFQGTTGAAVSLFQTYAFNVLQQLYRHIEAKDTRTLAVFAGLQTTMFGMNGLPFFDAINTHLIGGNTLGLGVQNNPEHKDLYSALPSFNKELGDWMLYGTASAFPFFAGQSPALFTRGDINPRHALVLPTAIVDVPVVSASMKAVKSIIDTGKNIGGGADISDSLLQGVEHLGLNRPLAGLAQVFAGQATDNKGALISANLDLQATAMLAGTKERSVVMDGLTRVFGARPMDEAVALNAMYRNKSYEAMDRARIERLGEVVKSKLYRNEFPTAEEYDDFMLRYTRAGGRVENFNQAIQRWSRDANVSIVNQLAERNNSPYARKLQDLMGGEVLLDYRSMPPADASIPAE